MTVDESVAPYSRLGGVELDGVNSSVPARQQSAYPEEDGAVKKKIAARVVHSELEYFSDTGQPNDAQKRSMRTDRKRADIRETVKQKYGSQPPAEGTVWVRSIAKEILLPQLVLAYRNGAFTRLNLVIEKAYSEVLFCTAMGHKKCFIFKFGCVGGWDFTTGARTDLLNEIRSFLREPTLSRDEEDEMSYVWSQHPAIRQDTIHLVTKSDLEKLAYTYAFAQSVKLSVFEEEVDATIDGTKRIPENIARTGDVGEDRKEIKKRIGDLFTSRFYINLHTDILDTPDIFWENDDFADHYSSCRGYLEIPKRVEILNKRLDIIKDLYDMLNDELALKHAHYLEWIVIYLITVEIAIEVLWNILVRGILKWF